MYDDQLTGTITANATFDTNVGDWIPGAQTMFTIPCRAESSTSDGYITQEDGKRIDYSWIIYLPKLSPSIKVGTEVLVSSYGETLLKDEVKRFQRGRFNCRVWL